MFFQEEINPKLVAIARSLTKDGDEQDDLYQEMWVHLWEMERDHPDQTESWYYQGCRHRAINYLHRGKSIDSKRRANVRLVDISVALPDWGVEAPLVSEGGEYESDLILYDLMRRLTKRQKKILNYLREGFSEREIGHFLGISQPAVSKQRRVLQEAAREVLAIP